MICVSVQRGVFKQVEVYHPTPEWISNFVPRIRTTDMIFVRDCPVRLPASTAVLSEEETQDAVIDLSLSQAELLRRMDAKSCRYIIRRAEKLGERITVRTNDAEARRDFMLFYNRFLELKHEVGGHNGFQVRPLTWSTMQKFDGLYDVSVAYVDSAPLAGHIHLRDENELRIIELLAPNARLDKGADKTLVGLAIRSLKWRRICDYKEQGFTTYSLGRMDPKCVTPSIASFKVSFGAEAVPQYDYRLAGPMARAAIRLRETVGSVLQRVGVKRRVSIT